MGLPRKDCRDRPRTGADKRAQNQRDYLLGKSEDYQENFVHMMYVNQIHISAGFLMAELE